MLFTLIGYWVPGGGVSESNGTEHSYMHAHVHLCTLGGSKFKMCDMYFLILSSLTMTIQAM